MLLSSPEGTDFVRSSSGRASHQTVRFFPRARRIGCFELPPNKAAMSARTGGFRREGSEFRVKKTTKQPPAKRRMDKLRSSFQWRRTIVFYLLPLLSLPPPCPNRNNFRQ